MIETDAPYLTPKNVKGLGNINVPQNIRYVAAELARYMQNPQRILGAFMMRNEKFRVRIDDVQHNIGGYYLYWKNYDAMVAAGLNSDITADVQGTGL